MISIITPQSNLRYTIVDRHRTHQPAEGTAHDRAAAATTHPPADSSAGLPSAVHVRQDIDVVRDSGVVVGVIQGDVTIGGRNVRAEELAYLDWVVRQYQWFWSQSTKLVHADPVDCAFRGSEEGQSREGEVYR